mmetsp:Transcript_50864/g.142348  ORF Transcript_50864/g.142348 Transcript_50864/m.142348 type:complete len:177 (+) Transcript_50864:217-747(+)
MEIGRRRFLTGHILTMATSSSTHAGGCAVSMEDVFEKELALLATLSSPPTPSTWISTFVARLDVTTRGVIADLNEVTRIAHCMAERFVFMVPSSSNQPPRATGLGCVGLALVALGVLPSNCIQPSSAIATVQIGAQQSKHGLEPQVVLAAIHYSTRYNTNDLLQCMHNVAVYASLA